MEFRRESLSGSGGREAQRERKGFAEKVVGMAEGESVEQFVVKFEEELSVVELFEAAVGGIGLLATYFYS